jgi:hypothetical protein
MSFPQRKPTDASHLAMQGLEEFAWPVTYSYFIQAPWGQTQQRLTVNVPQLEGLTEPTKRLGPLLWATVTAPAVVGDVSMYLCFVTTWKAYGVPQPVGGLELRGNLIAPSSTRDNTPQLVMLTGHDDKPGRRRLFMPGAPRDWTADGMLTREGFETLLPHAAGCMLGLAEPGLNSGLEWLVAYPNVLEASLSNLPGVAFRKVRHLRVCQHLDKAPEPSGMDDV